MIRTGDVQSFYTGVRYSKMCGVTNSEVMTVHRVITASRRDECVYRYLSSIQR
jgi:hypothetical protein